ncbi:Sperm-associated antigen 1 [Sesbania bispinosa]|nr:Sperm-associated antigen 1 [Sesbania bispinosa]
MEGYSAGHGCAQGGGDARRWRCSWGEGETAAGWPWWWPARAATAATRRDEDGATSLARAGGAAHEGSCNERRCPARNSEQCGSSRGGDGCS